MAEEVRRLTRQELLDALEQGWGQLLAVASRWTEEEASQYARNEGYPRLQDLLAHVIAWWEETLLAVPAIMNGHAHAFGDVDAFNAEAVSRYRTWTAADIEEHFDDMRATMARLIAEVPEEALENDDIYSWLFNAAVEHYEEHQPPSGPKVR